MSPNAWSWLPDAALSSPGVCARIDEAAAEWGERWFRDHRLVRGRLQYASAPASPSVVASTARLSVRAEPAAVERLTGHALAIDLSRLELNETDQMIVATLSNALLRDLAAVLDAALGAGVDDHTGEADASGGVLIELRDEDGRRSLVIETSRAALAAVRHADLPERTRRGPPLASIRAALADVPVTLSASLGSAVIALPEARRLAPGDVIVLDRPLEQPIDLFGPGDTVAVACARLADTASPRSLRLEAAAGRNRR